MKSALNNVNSWVGGIVGLLKTVIVFFVFTNILYTTQVDAIDNDFTSVVLLEDNIPSSLVDGVSTGVEDYNVEMEGDK